MKKNIKVEELKEAIRKVKEQGKMQYENPENEQVKNHGYGMEDAMTVLEILLKL